jgi:hypothetical protein
MLTHSSKAFIGAERGWLIGRRRQMTTADSSLGSALYSSSGRYRPDKPSIAASPIAVDDLISPIFENGRCPDLTDGHGRPRDSDQTLYEDREALLGAHFRFRGLEAQPLVGPQILSAHRAAATLGRDPRSGSTCSFPDGQELSRPPDRNAHP